MNSLCLPLLRDAERLDLLKLELPRVARARKNQILTVVRRPLEREVLSIQDDLAGRLLADWRSLAQSRCEVASLSSLLRLLACSTSSEAMGRAHAPSFGSGHLHPWLSDRAVLRRWLCESRTLWRKAAAPLIQEGLLPQWVSEEAPSADHFCADLFCAARFDACVEMNDARFVPLFAVRVLPHLPRGISFAAAREWEKAFLSLPVSLQDSAEVVCLAQKGILGLAWLKLALQEPMERVSVVLRAMIGGGALQFPPPLRMHRLLATLRHAGKQAHTFEDVVWAVRGARSGADPRWLVGAFSIAVILKPSTAPRHVLPDPIAAPRYRGVNWIFAALHRWKLRPGRTLANRFLRASSLFPGMREMVSQVSPGRWSSHRGREWLFWMSSFDVRPSQAPKKMRRWNALRTHWATMLRLVERSGETNRGEMMSLLKRGFQSEVLEKDEWLATDTLLWAEELLKVHALDPKLSVEPLLAFLPALESESRRQIAAHLPALMTAVKKLGWGFSTEDHLKDGVACLPVLGKRICLFVLLREPKLLIRTLIKLGALQHETAERISATFAEHPLATCDPEKATLKQLAVMVEANSAGRELGMPVKQRTWDRIREKKPLSPHLLDADKMDLEHAWAKLAVEVLLELIDRELRLLFHVQRSETVEHRTLLYLHTLDEQRRKAKRLVRCLAAGGSFSRAQHPLNVKWGRTLPSHTAAQWALGFHRVCEVPKRGRLVFETERDPLQIFRMGDYGGSCLGVGSINQYSTLTNALDANKQVVYARDSAGKVIARQLLALSDAGTLVCFRIYPEHSTEAMQQAFIQYDRAYAAALSVPLHKQGEYKVSSPMNMDWYDDGAWTPWEENGND
jgi:hypothetical protein